MNKETIIVPKGIKYLTEWKGFSLPNHPAIIDKKLTGCGFTEYVIRGNFNAVLISPRKALLENKAAQHNPFIITEKGERVEIPEQRTIYYARTDEQDLDIDKDIQSGKSKQVKEKISVATKSYEDFKKELEDAIQKFLFQGKPIKLEVTYDSFRKVREVLEQELPHLINSFYFIVDEFQAVFTDSKFKSNTEIEFVSALQGLQNVSFVSATPMMEEYLDLVDEFKDLPYYELDWEKEDPSRVMSPEIVAKPCKSINEIARKIISEFKDEKYQRKALVNNTGLPIKVVEAKELIFYVNSIKNICDIIRQNKLMYEEIGVICADTTENRKKVRDAFRQVYKELGREVSEVPKEKDIISKVPVPDPLTGNIENKPIMLCSKTVYLGADFYSDCARSIVLSDSSIECLAVDITLDLPQIVGRQRSDFNPWKNSIEIYFKEGNGIGEISEEEFKKLIDAKVEKTNDLLSLYEKGNSKEKHAVAEKYLDVLKAQNYRNDYVAVNQHAGSDLKPQFNNLVMIAEKRAFDIQQKDYKDRFTVFNRIGEVFGLGITDISKELEKLNQTISSLKLFPDKMKACCEWVSFMGAQWSNYIDEPYRTYIQTLGIDFIATSSYRKYNLDEAMIQRGEGRIFTPDDLDEAVLGYFQVGQRYSKAQIKSDLGEIYSRLGVPGKVTAASIERWFEIRRTIISNKGKKSEGYELLKQK